MQIWLPLNDVCTTDGSGESDGLRRLLSFSMACCSSKETQLQSTMSIIAEAQVVYSELFGGSRDRGFYSTKRWSRHQQASTSSPVSADASTGCGGLQQRNKEDSKTFPMILLEVISMLFKDFLYQNVMTIYRQGRQPSTSRWPLYAAAKSTL